MENNTPNQDEFAAGFHKTADQISEEFDHEIKEAAHWFGGWDKLRERLAMLEDNENEAAFDRWSERRYSIDG